MELVNLSPFPAAVFRQFDEEGRLDGYVAARARFSVRPDGPMSEQSPQPEFRWEDEYDGDPHTNFLLAQADLTPEKRATDVTFLGEAFAPDGLPAPRWTSAIRIADRLDCGLNITGPRQWVAKTRRTWKGLLEKNPSVALESWELTEPLAVRSVPIDWRLAAGGRILGVDDADSSDCHPENPLGIGAIDEKRSDFKEAYPAPQITLRDEPLEKVRTKARPAGFGPISPWWRQRLRYAGTYDDHWLNHRHPLLPRDFDYRFWQCAPPQMIVDPWLEGGETFELENLHPRHSLLRGRLPGLKLVVNLFVPGAPREARELALDGVHLDFRDGAQNCDLTFRVRFPLDEAERARLVLRAFDCNFRRWSPKPNPLRRSETLS